MTYQEQLNKYVEEVICICCGRKIEEGEPFLDVGQGPVCDDCEGSYLFRNFMDWVPKRPDFEPCKEDEHDIL